MGEKSSRSSGPTTFFSRSTLESSRPSLLPSSSNQCQRNQYPFSIAACTGGRSQRFPSSGPTLTIVLILRYHKISKARCAPELTRDKVQYRCNKMSKTIHLRMDFVVDD